MRVVTGSQCTPLPGKQELVLCLKRLVFVNLSWNQLEKVGLSVAKERMAIVLRQGNKKLV